MVKGNKDAAAGSACWARDVPGLTRVKMLMHQLKDDVYDRLAALNVWSYEAHGVLRESSADAMAKRDAVLNTFQQTWVVAREVFGNTHGSNDGTLQQKDISRLSLAYVQSYALALYAAPETVSGADGGQMLRVAVSCLEEMSKLGATGELALDRLGEGFGILYGLVQECMAMNGPASDYVFGLALEYTAALTSLAGAAINRRKLFSFGVSKLLKYCLMVPCSPSEGTTEPAAAFLSQWSKFVGELLTASLFDEKHVDELSKGPLPDAAAGISPIFGALPEGAGVAQSAEEEKPAGKGKRRRVDAGAVAPGSPEPRRPTVYTSELYAEIESLFSGPSALCPLFSIEAGVERLLKIFIEQTLGKLTDGHHGSTDSLIVLKRKAYAQVLHFALSLLESCSHWGPDCSARASAGVAKRVRCRGAVLKCLAEQFSSTAIPDHPTLNKYSSLLRTLYVAILADLEKVTTGEARTDDDILNNLLDIAQCLVRVDHRPVVAAPYSDTDDPSVQNDILQALVNHINRGDCAVQEGGGSPSGAEALLVSLIKLHHELRQIPNFIYALFSHSSEDEAVLQGAMAILLNSPSVQRLLFQITRSMPGVQLRECWVGLQAAYFQSGGDSTAASLVLTLEAWAKPLVRAYMSGNAVLSDVPVSDVLLPLLKEMGRSIDVILSAAPSKAKAKSAKRKLDTYRDTDGSRESRALASSLVVIEGIVSLCAAYAPHSLSLVNCTNAGSIETADCTLLEWRAVYTLARHLLTQFSANSGASWPVASMNAQVPTLTLSCGLQLFTLLVTVDAVKDSGVILSLDQFEGGTEMHAPVEKDLHTLLLELLRSSCADSTTTMPVSVCALVLGHLPVWSHLLYAGRAYDTDTGEENEKAVKVFVDSCMDSLVSYLLGSDLKDTLRCELVVTVSSGLFLEHDYLMAAVSASVVRCCCSKASKVSLPPTLCEVLLSLPEEMLVQCLDATLSAKSEETLLLAIHNSVVAALEQQSDIVQNVQVLLKYYANSRSTSQLFALTRRLCAVILATLGDDDVNGLTCDLLLMLLNNCLSSHEALLENSSEVLALISTVFAEEYSHRWGGSRSKPGVKKAKAASLIENTSTIFLDVFKCVSNCLVSLLARYTDEGDIADQLFQIISVFAESFVSRYSGVRAPVQARTNMISILNYTEIVSQCGRLVLCLQCLEVCTDIEKVGNISRVLLEDVARSYKQLITSNLDFGVEENVEFPYARFFYATGIAVLLLPAASTVVDLSGVPVADVATRILFSVASSYSSHVAETRCDMGLTNTHDSAVISNFKMTCHALLLMVHDAGSLQTLYTLAVSSLSMQTRAECGLRHRVTAGALMCAFVEALVSSLLENPSRVAAESSEYGVSIASVLASISSALQETLVYFFDPLECLVKDSTDDSECVTELCFSAISSLRCLLSTFQQYQQKRAKEKHSMNSHGAKRHRKRLQQRAEEEAPGGASDGGVEAKAKHGGDILNERLQDLMDLWAAMALRVCSNWLCKIGTAASTATHRRPAVYLFVEKVLRLIELAVTIQSDTHLNTTGGVLSVLLRQTIAVLCSHAKLEQSSHSPASHSAITTAIRQSSRLVAGVAASRALQKYTHLFAAVMVDVMAMYPSVCNATSALGGASDTATGAVDITPLVSGLFCLFDRCRTPKQRLQMFAALGSGSAVSRGGGSEAKMLLSDLHETYLREYKFVGMA